MKDQKSQGPLKLGLVATDPLRILGLQSILAETGIKGGPVEIVPLSVPGALDSSGVSLILIDSACTSHIFELLAVFRRARPHLRLIVLGLEEDHEHIQRIIGAGAKGYLAHTAKASEVRMAIEVVEDGSAWRRGRCWPISWICPLRRRGGRPPRSQVSQSAKPRC